MVDVYKRSQLNLYDAVDNLKHFKITQGESDCKMVVPNIYDLNCPQMKLTSGDQVVSNVASQILSNVADIAQESASRLSADVNLQSNIDSEASTRASADSALETKINVEKARIDFIVSNTDASALDSLTEVVNAFQSADSSLISQVATLQSQLTALQAVVDALAENP